MLTSSNLPLENLRRLGLEPSLAESGHDVRDRLETLVEGLRALLRIRLSGGEERVPFSLRHAQVIRGGDHDFPALEDPQLVFEFLGVLRILSDADLEPRPLTKLQPAEPPDFPNGRTSRGLSQFSADLLLDLTGGEPPLR